MLYCISTSWIKLKCSIYGISYGHRFKDWGDVALKINENVLIGDNIRINSSFRLNPIAVSNRTSFCVMGEGRLSIGNETGISNSYFVCMSEIRIGNQVMIGAGYQLYDNNFHPLISEYRIGRGRDDRFTKSRLIVIDDKAFVGVSTIILKGTSLEEGSIIGARSVICGDIPPYEIWAGNPARFIKKAK